MRLLAIDTSGEACSAALIADSGPVQRLSLEPRRHGELILAMAEELLREAGFGLAQLDALAFGRGPGSFTGVRIAAAVIQGLAFGADLPVVPVSTLAALAQRHYRTQGAHRSLAALDARMGEVYWGCYERDEGFLMRLVGDEEVNSPERVTLPRGSGWNGIGSGWMAHEDRLRERLGSRVQTATPEAVCESQDIAILAASEFAAGRVVPAESALPIYLRDRVTAAP